MDANVRDAKVVGYEWLIESLDLPDPNDRHVERLKDKGNY